MKETPITLADIAALAALANGIIPADDRDAGAATVHAGAGIAERMRRSPYGQVYIDGLKVASLLARDKFHSAVHELDSLQINELLSDLRDQSPVFFDKSAPMYAGFTSVIQVFGNASAFLVHRQTSVAILILTNLNSKSS